MSWLTIRNRIENWISCARATETLKQDMDTWFGHVFVNIYYELWWQLIRYRCVCNLWVWQRRANWTCEVWKLSYRMYRSLNQSHLEVVMCAKCVWLKSTQLGFTQALNWSQWCRTWSQHLIWNYFQKQMPQGYKHDTLLEIAIVINYTSPSLKIRNQKHGNSVDCVLRLVDFCEKVRNSFVVNAPRKLSVKWFIWWIRRSRRGGDDEIGNDLIWNRHNFILFFFLLLIVQYIHAITCNITYFNE